MYVARFSRRDAPVIAPAANEHPHVVNEGLLDAPHPGPVGGVEQHGLAATDRLVSRGPSRATRPPVVREQPPGGPRRAR